MKKLKKVVKIFGVTYISLVIINFLFGGRLMSDLLLNPIVLILGIASAAFFFAGVEKKYFNR